MKVRIEHHNYMRQGAYVTYNGKPYIIRCYNDPTYLSKKWNSRVEESDSYSLIAPDLEGKVVKVGPNDIKFMNCEKAIVLNIKLPSRNSETFIVTGKGLVMSLSTNKMVKRSSNGLNKKQIIESARILKGMIERKEKMGVCGTEIELTNLD